MHGAKFCTKIYANAKKLQVDTTRRSRLPTANRVYQQLSSIAHPRAARTSPALCPYAARTYQTAYNR